MYYTHSETHVIRISDGALIAKNGDSAASTEFRAWVLSGGIATTPAAQTVTQYDADIIRYSKRARAKDQILAEFAAENMARVRSGVWTVPQLISLTQDSGLKALLDNVNTLSFEIAASMVPGLTHALLTPSIKSGWVAKLQSHFYNE